MPRKRRGFEAPRPRTDGTLVQRLVQELKSARPAGQPIIEEDEFPTGKLRVNVIWDEWDRVPLEDRTATILRAYEEAEGKEYRDRIALASGLTVPEAYAGGMLPFQVFPVIRRGDGVTKEQCREALIEEGASTLFGQEHPQLRFATGEDAEAARKRLIAKLPKSDEVWVITKEVGTVEDWAERLNTHEAE